MYRTIPVNIYELPDEGPEKGMAGNIFSQIIDEFGNRVKLLVITDGSHKEFDISRIVLDSCKYNPEKDVHENFIIEESKTSGETELKMNIPDIEYEGKNITDMYFDVLLEAHKLPNIDDLGVMIKDLYDMSELFRMILRIPEENQHKYKKLLFETVQQQVNIVAGLLSDKTKDIPEKNTIDNDLDNGIIEFKNTIEKDGTNITDSEKNFINKMLNYTYVQPEEVRDRFLDIKRSYTDLGKKIRRIKKAEPGRYFQHIGSLLEIVRKANKTTRSGIERGHLGLIYLNDIETLLLGYQTLLNLLENNKEPTGEQREQISGSLIQNLERIYHRYSQSTTGAYCEIGKKNEGIEEYFLDCSEYIRKQLTNRLKGKPQKRPQRTTLKLGAAKKVGQNSPLIESTIRHTNLTRKLNSPEYSRVNREVKDIFYHLNPLEMGLDDIRDIHKKTRAAQLFNSLLEICENIFEMLEDQNYEKAEEIFDSLVFLDINFQTLLFNCNDEKSFSDETPITQLAQYLRNFTAK